MAFIDAAMVSLFLQIAWIEVRSRLRQRSTYGLLLAVISLLSLSVVLGTEDVRRRRVAYNQQLAVVAQEQVRPKFPLMGWPDERVLRVARAPELGTLVARGEDARLSPYFDFGPSGVIWARSLLADAPLLQAGTLLDVESIVRVIGGLLALLLGVDVLDRSRTRGQLRAWKSLGFNPVVGALGKLLGGVAVLWTASIAAIVAAAVFAVWQLPDDGSDVARVFARSFLPIPLYLGWLAAIGAAVALWCRTSAASLLAGIALWIVVAMIGPQVAAVSGRLVVRTVTRAEFEVEREREYEADMLAVADSLGAAVAAKTGHVPGPVVVAAIEQHAEDLEKIWSAGANEARRVADEHRARWLGSQRKQRRIDSWAQTLLPGASFARAVAALAGTGSTLAERWYAAAEAQQLRLNAALFDDLPVANFRVPVPGGQMERLPRHPPRHWREMPQFPVPPTTQVSWTEAVPPLTALVAYLCLAVAGLAAAARRI